MSDIDIPGQDGLTVEQRFRAMGMALRDTLKKYPSAEYRARSTAVDEVRVWGVEYANGIREAGLAQIESAVRDTIARDRIMLLIERKPAP